YPDKSIREIFEKKGRTTIGTTPPGGSDEWVMRKVFEFYKTTYNDVRSRGGKVILVSYTDLTTQYRDRNMDILFANLAVPGAAIQEASLGRKMRILPMDDDLIKFMEAHGLSRGVIPRGSYKDVVNNDVDSPTIAMANAIAANAKVSEPREMRATHLLFLLPLAFLLFPATGRSPTDRVTRWDWAGVALSIVPCVYVLLNVHALTERWEGVHPVTPFHVIMGTIMVLA